MSEETSAALLGGSKSSVLLRQHVHMWSLFMGTKQRDACYFKNLKHLYHV